MQPLSRGEFTVTSLGVIAGIIRAPSGAPQTRIRVDATRISVHLGALAAFGRDPAGGLSRLAYSDSDSEARQVVTGWMREAGLDVSSDQAAILAGRRPSREPALKPLAIGSHIDSVPNGGNYDGRVGSVDAIEVARTLRQNGPRAVRL